MEVTWGQKKTSLLFDRYPFPEDHPRGYEPEVINVLERFVEPGDSVVDAGASVGYHTCLLAKLVGEKGIVFAFEPHLESFQYLAHHVHISNRLNNVALLRLALWKFDCPEVDLWSVEDMGYSSLHRYVDGTSEKVEAVALDNVLPGKDHPRLIKIDCEGVEAEILMGAENILKRGVDCVVLELNYDLMRQVGRSDHVMRKYMVALGYEMFLISISDGKGGFMPPFKVAPEIEVRLTGGHHVNVMFSTEEKVHKRW